MRRLLLSDIHSNMEALGACMTRAGEARYDDILCCGDVVGYGPQPNEAVEVLRDARALTIRGNHDRVASGLDEPTDFNAHAAEAAIWTRATLDEDNTRFLRDLPVGPLAVAEATELVHGAVTHEDDYIMCTGDAADSFALTEAALIFFGHTHFQCTYAIDASNEIAFNPIETSDGHVALTLDPSRRYLVNPGSVGQPRDNDTRAAFAIWDEEKGVVEFYRVAYDIGSTQQKMRAADLPAYLIDRLSRGR